MSEGASLPELVSQEMEIERRIIENDGEIPDDLSKALEQLDTDLATKIDGYEEILWRVKDRAESLKKRAKSIQKTANSLEAFQKGLKNRLKEVMKAKEVDRLDGVDWYFKKQRVKASLVINEAELPSEYLMEVTTYVPDKERIRKLLEDGGVIEGATLEEGHSIKSYARTPVSDRPKKKEKKK